MTDEIGHRTLLTPVLASLFGGALLMFAPGVAAAETPQRDGFTLAMGFGLGVTHLDGGSHTKVGLAPLSVGLGGFVNPKVALTARLTSTTWFVESGDHVVQFSQSLLGATLEVWVSDRLLIAGGPGLMTVSASALPGRSLRGLPEPVSGFGGSARVGYTVANWTDHNLRAVIEVMPGVYDNATVVGSSFTFEYQWF